MSCMFFNCHLMSETTLPLLERCWKWLLVFKGIIFLLIIDDDDDDDHCIDDDVDNSHDNDIFPLSSHVWSSIAFAWWIRAWRRWWCLCSSGSFMMDLHTPDWDSFKTVLYVQCINYSHFPLKNARVAFVNVSNLERLIYQGIHAHFFVNNNPIDTYMCYCNTSSFEGGVQMFPSSAVLL